MITVLAVDRNDGWFFAKDGERILLLRPPYRLPEAQVVSEGIVARSVTRDGYMVCDRGLATWAEVLAFVRGKVAEHRAAEGRAAPDENVGRTFLRSAPVSAVERFLDRIERELVPRGELDDAEKILHAMQIESPVLLDSAELARRTAKLLEEVLQTKEARHERLVRDDDQFPRLAQKGRLQKSFALGQKIAQARSMFVQP